MFKVKKSQIEKAGLGVFYVGCGSIQKGTKLFDYEGIVLGGNKERGFRSDKSYNLGDGYEIFGTGIGSFVNDGLDVFPSNCTFVQKGEGKESNVYLVSTCEIYPHDELFVSYGGDFWKFHKIVKQS